MKDGEEILIRRVEADEVTDHWLDAFERYQESERWYQYQGDRLVMRMECFVDDWTLEEKREKVEDIRKCLAGGGVLFAALQGALPVGFALVSGEVKHGCTELDKLHVSRPARRRGLGKKLLLLAKDAARQMGAEWMFLASNPAEETQEFYIAMGCEDGRDLLPWFTIEYGTDRPLKLWVGPERDR